jgi:hypothetical protein
VQHPSHPPAAAAAAAAALLVNIGSVNRKNPSPPRHEENSACERAGTARARIASSKAHI